MPPKKRSRKKNSSTKKYLIVIAVIAIVGFGIIAWHDGIIGATPIADINQGDVDNGTSVTIRGELVLIVFDLMTVSDGDGHSVTFDWDGAKPALHSIVVVRGEAAGWFLADVTSVDATWIFQ